MPITIKQTLNACALKKITSFFSRWATVEWVSSLVQVLMLLEQGTVFVDGLQMSIGRLMRNPVILKYICHKWRKNMRSLFPAFSNHLYTFPSKYSGPTKLFPPVTIHILASFSAFTCSSPFAHFPSTYVLWRLSTLTPTTVVIAFQLNTLNQTLHQIMIRSACFTLGRGRGGKEGGGRSFLTRYAQHVLPLAEMCLCAYVDVLAVFRWSGLDATVWLPPSRHR